MLGAAVGDAIPAELINALSRLRWLFVTARGSSFRFRDPATDPQTLKQLLGVRYVLAGSVSAFGQSLSISTELSETETGTIVWSNRHDCAAEEINEARQQIVNDVVASLEIHIPYKEAQIARMLAPDQLGAWSHFHIGLQHLYRFNRSDNAVAAEQFQRALAITPDFARAHSGLSFTHWQNAFMNFGDDRASLLDLAERDANRAVELDPLDPFAVYNAARVCWLRGDREGFTEKLDQAILMNPNFAQAKYSRALCGAFSGDGELARTHSTEAMKLSPLDPLKYAMMSSYSMSLIGDGEYAEAARWAEKACHLPGAHFYIDMIAASALELAGDREAALVRAGRAKEAEPGAGAEMFFASFPFGEGSAKRDLQNSFAAVGL